MKTLTSHRRLNRCTLALLLSRFGFSLSAWAIDVNTTADNLTAGDGLCTLREAITNANGNSDTTGGDCAAGAGADTIKLPAGTKPAHRPRRFLPIARSPATRPAAPVEPSRREPRRRSP